MVSSDDDEILQWAQLHGYEALPRPEALAADDATISAVARHVADELDWHGDVAVFQPTSPLRTADSIRRAVEEFRAGDADSLTSVVRETHLFWYDENDDLDGGPAAVRGARQPPVRQATACSARTGRSSSIDAARPARAARRW